MESVIERDSFGLFRGYIGHLDLFEPHLNESEHRFNISVHLEWKLEKSKLKKFVLKV